MQSPLLTFARIGSDRPGAEHIAAGNKGLQTKPRTDVLTCVESIARAR